MTDQQKPATKSGSQPVKSAALDGMDVTDLLEESAQRRLDEIEMIGEEKLAGFSGAESEVSAGMRYLHCSRTIHQLITDRNRAVGLYIAVATLLWTASTALLNATPSPKYIIPLETIQKWSLPTTFGVLTVLALLVAFLLIRTRIGLIYEVAKMNVLLGLPLGRVKRINALSIFFIMQLIISLAGGFSAAMLSLYLFRLAGMRVSAAALPASAIGFVVCAALMALYIATVLWTTSDDKLRGG